MKWSPWSLAAFKETERQFFCAALDTDLMILSLLICSLLSDPSGYSLHVHPSPATVELGTITELK